MRGRLAFALLVSSLAAAAASAAAPIHLASGDLDPASERGRALAAAAPNGEGPQLHLVQLAGAVRPEWLAALREAGLTPVDYIPANAYLVWGDAAALARLGRLAGAGGPVAWHGDWAAELKIDRPGRRALAAAAATAVRTWAIQLVNDPAANAPTLAMIAGSRSGSELLHMSILRYVDIVVPLPAAAVSAIAARPDVISVKAWADPVKLGERDDQIVAGNLSGSAPAAGDYLAWLASEGFSQSQFTGGFLVDVSDSGIDDGSTSPNHPGLCVGGSASGASRIADMYLVGSPSYQSTDQGCDGHGTISAHVLAGYDGGTGAPWADASGFRYGLGVCPFVSINNSVIFDPWAFTHPDYGVLLSTMYQNGARITSNGWGAPTSGSYDIVAQAYDALVRDAQPSTATYPAAGNQEIAALFAAGNDGPAASTIDSPGVAKNVLTIGAAEGVQSFGGADQCGVDDTMASSADDMESASSRGPAADGRAKPDLVAPGTHVSGGVPQASSPGPDGTALACYASNDLTTLRICAGPGSLPSALYFPESGQQLYTASSGSSMAVAAASGAAALVRQRFLNQGLPAPSPAMTKAVLMNSARYLTGAGANDTLPSPAQGYGEIDLGDALDRVGGTPAYLRDELAGDLFTASGQVRTFTGSVANTGKPFRVTLAWTDAPGSTAGSAWNNDLDLSVTVGGQTYLGNVFSGGVSVTGGSADYRNNVESVFLPAGTSGSFTVTVTAANIVSDGVPNNATSPDQDFALVVYNAVSSCSTPGPTAGSNSPVCAGGAIDLTASGAAGATWAWSGPNGFASTQQNPSISGATAANAGTYYVTQTVAGCTSPAATVSVTVNPLPSAPAAGSNSPVVAGGTLQLTASAVSGATYAWTGPNGFSSSQQNPTIASVTTAASGIYGVTASVNGCPSPAAETQAWVTAPRKLYTLTPCRVVDTRNTGGPLGGPALAGASSRTFVVGGACGVPVDAAAVAANVTVTNVTVDGDLRLSPSGFFVPGTSVINFQAGQTRANNATLALGGSPGGVVVTDDQPSGSLDFILDVTGYYR